jgi:chromosome segregation ATPase
MFMNVNKIKLLVTIVVAVIVVLFLTRLFSCNEEAPVPAKVVTDDPGKLRKELARKEQDMNERLDSIEVINQELQAQAAKAQSALTVVKKENRSLKRTIDDLLTVHYTATDTVVKLENCDSLATTLQEVVALSNTKDSIYDDLTANLRQQLTLQDSVIDWQQYQYDSLHTSYNKVLDQQTALLKENDTQRKAIRRQKRGKGFLGVVLAVIGGLFVHQTLK